MKPFKEEDIKTTGEAIMLANSRASTLKSFCRAMWDTSQSTGGKETDRDTLNRLAELVLIMEDELEYLEEELEIAGNIELKARRATA